MDIPYTPELAKRYRRIAGTYSGNEQKLCAKTVAWLSATGARALTVAERDGTTIWRLRSECETLDDTRRRLGRYR